MDLGLNNRVALVAASSRGLGFATAKVLVQEGARVAICGRNPDRLAAAEEQLAGDTRGQAQDEPRVFSVVADLTVEEEAKGLVQETVECFGRLDILVTNAGGPPGGTFETTDIAAWERGINLTLMSAVRLIHESLPYLRQSDMASILTVTSFSVKQPIAGLLLSNVIRPAVVGLTKSLSQELGPEGIRVNSILPGWTETERVHEIMAYRSKQSGRTPQEEMAKITATIPLGRMGAPEEFGRIAAFLVSPAASYISGIMVQIDGGLYGGLL